MKDKIAKEIDNNQKLPHFKIEYNVFLSAASISDNPILKNNIFENYFRNINTKCNANYDEDCLSLYTLAIEQLGVVSAEKVELITEKLLLKSGLKDCSAKNLNNLENTNLNVSSFSKEVISLGDFENGKTLFIPIFFTFKKNNLRKYQMDEILTSNTIYIPSKLIFKNIIMSKSDTIDIRKMLDYSHSVKHCIVGKG